MESGLVEEWDKHMEAVPAPLAHEYAVGVGPATESLSRLRRSWGTVAELIGTNAAADDVLNMPTGMTTPLSHCLHTCIMSVTSQLAWRFPSFAL